MVPRLAIRALAAALVVGSSACSSVRVSVNSLSCPGLAAPCRYYLAPVDPDTSADDLQFQEFAAYLHRALDALGYQRSDLDSAEEVIFLGYGVGDTSTTVSSITTPIHGQTGGGVSNFSATTYGQGGTTLTSGSLYTAPTYGIVGSETMLVTETTYPCFLNVVAFSRGQVGQDGSPKMAWTTTAISHRKQDDLREVFPCILAAAFHYFGKDTGKQVGVGVNPRSPEVAMLRGIAAP